MTYDVGHYTTDNMAEVEQGKRGSPQGYRKSHILTCEASQLINNVHNLPIAIYNRRLLLYILVTNTNVLEGNHGYR